MRKVVVFFDILKLVRDALIRLFLHFCMSNFANICERNKCNWKFVLVGFPPTDLAHQ